YLAIPRHDAAPSAQDPALLRPDRQCLPDRHDRPCATARPFGRSGLPTLVGTGPGVQRRGPGWRRYRPDRCLPDHPGDRARPTRRRPFPAAAPGWRLPPPRRPGPRRLQPTLSGSDPFMNAVRRDITSLRRQANNGLLTLIWLHIPVL